MDMLSLMRERYSVRSFADTPVPREMLKRILEAGWFAPTAVNYQPQRILVIDDPEGREKLKACTPYHFDAPLTLLVCYDRKISWKRRADGKDSGEIDAAIVTTHMMLEAEAEGLGTTWVMAFDPDRLRAEFEIPDAYAPVALLPMGFPSATAKPSAAHAVRQPADDWVSYTRFKT